MFAEKEFYMVNREERHFGFLLFSSIIYDQSFREYFFNLINERLCDGKFVNADDYDIYSEVALFRDYWDDLGDPNNYTKELDLKRRKIIEEFLQLDKNNKIDISIIDKYDMFWTDVRGKSKLRFPGQWRVESINSLQKEEKINNRQLIRIKWACNAKPDLLIISKKSALFIELKLESGFVRKKTGYDQQKTQKDIINLAKMTIPYFSNSDFNFNQIILDKHNGKIRWDDIKNIFKNDLVEKHMLNIPK